MPATTHLTMDSITASLSPQDKANAEEISSLLLQIYQTLIHMRYLPAHHLHPGPHDLTRLLPFFQKLQLAPQIIHLYTILPYVSSKCHDFYQGGYFADFRNKSDVEDGRNTMYADDRREQMRPWMTPLSLLCNHMSVLFYDSKRHRIGIFEQCDNSSRDRVLRKMRGVVNLELAAPEDLGSDSDCESSSEDGGSDSDDERPRKKLKKEDEGHHPRLGCGSQGKNVYDDMPSRPAGDVLRDILKQYETLEEVPWVYEHGSPRDWPKGVEKLYFKHGWPGKDFNAEEFEMDKMRLAAMETIKEDAEEVFKQVKQCRQRVEGRNQPDFLLLKRQIATAETPDEEWLARYHLWRKEQEMERSIKDLEEAEAKRDRRFPNGSRPSEKPEDLVLWEVQKWRRDIAREEETLKHTIEQAEMFAAGLLDHAPSPKSMKHNIEKEKRHLELLYKLLQKSREDAARLCPGVEELPVEDENSRVALFHNRAHVIEFHQKEIDEIKGFMATVPMSCAKTRQFLQGEIEASYEGIKRSNEWWDGHDEAIKHFEKRKEAFAAIKARQKTEG
ncbi:hypothetical protein QBC41DRAFT_284418 [Cercophora samala]|uniref:Uncharacterized protein n=1 Tax=Cercophora samala TaxID=330535 RepID=A0AA40D7W9_9PEZI|nr:hypothetical protein QBC41DRAFT_284418 [Cercophora samala]